MKHVKYLLPLVIGWLIGLMFFLSSCVTEKKRLEICKSCPVKITVKDSIRVEVRERPVQLWVHDTVNWFLPNPCAQLCDSFGNLKKTNITVRGNKGAQVNLISKGNTLYFETIIDSLKATGTVKDSIINRIKDTTIEVPARCELDHIGWWDRFFISSGKILLCVLIVAVGYWLKK